MSYNLFLDDERIPSKVTWVELPHVIWDIVRTYKEFVKKIETQGVPAFVAFDHDLADYHYEVLMKDDGAGAVALLYEDEPREATGFHACKWLVDYCHENQVPFPDFVVHSMNPIGRQAIYEYVKNAKRTGFIS